MSEVFSDPRIEVFIIGCCIGKPFNFLKVCARCNVDTFTHLEHRVIFSEMLFLHSQGYECNMQTIAERHREIPHLYQHAANCQVQSRNIDLDYYLDEIKELQGRRELRDVLTERAKTSYLQEGNFENLLASSVKSLMALSSHALKVKSETGEAIAESIFEDGKLRVDTTKVYPTGFASLDTMMRGWRAGTLTYLGGRPGQGKTTFVLSIISNLVNAGIQCGIFTIEMSKEEIVQKMVGMEANVAQMKMENGTISPLEVQRVSSVVASDFFKRLYISDGNPNITEIQAEAKRLVECYGVQVIVIDYFTLIEKQNPKASAHEEYTDVSRKLKLLARDLKVPVICVAQLNRQSTMREGDELRLSDFRETGSVEQDADVVLFIQRKKMSSVLTLAKERKYGHLGDIAITFNNGKFVQKITNPNLLEEVDEEYQSPHKD